MKYTVRGCPSRILVISLRQSTSHYVDRISLSEEVRYVQILEVFSARTTQLVKVELQIIFNDVNAKKTSRQALRYSINSRPT